MLLSSFLRGLATSAGFTNLICAVSVMALALVFPTECLLIKWYFSLSFLLCSPPHISHTYTIPLWMEKKCRLALYESLNFFPQVGQIMPPSLCTKIGSFFILFWLTFDNMRRKRMRTRPQAKSSESEVKMESQSAIVFTFLAFDYFPTRWQIHGELSLNILNYFSKN